MGGVMCPLRVESVYCETCDDYVCGDDARARDARGCARDVETAHARAKRDASSVDASDRREKAGRKKNFFCRRAWK